MSFPPFCVLIYVGVIALCRLLVAILEESRNPTAIAVASHDIGEYVRYYPRGKRWAQCVCVRVLTRPFPKGTVPFGGSNMPFGYTPKLTMCPLALPQNQHIFNYLKVSVVKVELD